MIPPRGPFRKLVVLGESTVAGGPWLEGPGECWPFVLHHLIESVQYSPLEYHNAGLSASVISPKSPGYEASVKPSAAERLDKEVIEHRPDLLVIAYGLNDMRAGFGVEGFIREFEGVISVVEKNLTAMVVIAGVYYMNGYRYYPPFDRGGLKVTAAYNDALRTLAGRHGFVYADTFAAEGSCDHVIHPDGVHANKIGSLLIAHKVFEAIVHAAPGLADAVQKRDAANEWTRRVLAERTQSVEKPT